MRIFSKLFSKPITVATHSGRFHMDDVFAMAFLKIYAQHIGKRISWTRTRPQQEIDKAHIVIDVGKVYDPKINRYDHHQKEGASQRKNGIPYASFGLVLKDIGPLFLDEKIIAHIDYSLASTIDAIDNGKDILDTTYGNMQIALVHQVFQIFYPSWDTKPNYDKSFSRAVCFAQKILTDMIAKESLNIIGRTEIQAEAQKLDTHNHILVLEKRYPDFLCWQALEKFEHILFFIKPSSNDAWSIITTKPDASSFTSRIYFPESWRGLDDKDLETATGISGGVYIHRSGYGGGAQTKESAIAMAKKAIQETDA